MFDNTQAVAQKIIDDLKKCCFVVSLISQLIFVAYYIYSIAVGNGYLVVNCLLLSFAVVYFIIYVVIYARGQKGYAKDVKKWVKRVYRYIKYILHAFTLGMALYLIFSDMDNAKFFNILLTALNVIAFVVQLGVEILRMIVERYATLVKTAIQQDTEPIVSFMHKVNNPISTFVGAVNRPISALARRLNPDEELEQEVGDKKKMKVFEIAADYYDEKTVKEREKKLEKKRQRKQETKDKVAELKQNFHLIGVGLKNKMTRKPKNVDAEAEVVEQSEKPQKPAKSKKSRKNKNENEETTK